MEHITSPVPAELTPDSDRPNPTERPVRRLLKPSRRAMGRALGAGLLIAIVAGQVALWWQFVKLRSRLDDIAFQAELLEDASGDDAINPSVGVIQFLHSGFSITIDSLSYSPTGVTLVGEFGNPKALVLSSVTLDFTARRPRWTMRAAWERDPFALLMGGDIGSAEVAIGNVPYGKQTPFRVTIPNVRQAKDSTYVISVSLKGERYSYPL